MSAVYQPCTQAVNACGDNGAYYSFLGGTQVSQPQITSPDHPCLVGFICMVGGIPATIWTGPTVTYEPTEQPKPPIFPPPTKPPVVNPPVENPCPDPQPTPEPATWLGAVTFLVGAVLGKLFMSRKKRD